MVVKREEEVSSPRGPGIFLSWAAIGVLAAVVSMLSGGMMLVLTMKLESALSNMRLDMQNYFASKAEMQDIKDRLERLQREHSEARDRLVRLESQRRP